MRNTFTLLCCLWRRLSLLFCEAFAMIIFLSFKCFTIFFFMNLLVAYLKQFPLETGRRQLSEITYAMMGVLASVHVRTVGGLSHIFAVLVRMY